MTHLLQKEFYNITKDVVSMSKTIKNWEDIESDDMFQKYPYIGGYDTDEEEFCFSYFDDKENEYWFQLSLEEINSINKGIITVVNIIEADF